MTANSDCYSIKWNDYHNYLGGFFVNLFNAEQFTDVTLCVEKVYFKCHKVVLSAGSPYFQELLASTQTKHPILILAGVNAEDIKIIIDFIYHGEMKNVDYERFLSVLQTAEMLKINGLTDVTIYHSTGEMVEEKSEGQTENAVLENEKVHSVIEEPVIESSLQSDLAEINEQNKTRRKQTHQNVKKFREENLDKALKDMEWGMPLTEAAKLYKIPRSTLYSKAKNHSGLQIVSRKEHSIQDIHPALQAIADGMSLKRAAEEFSIPKTVLWRRVQKRFDILSKVKCRKKGGGKQGLDPTDNFKDKIENEPSCSSVTAEDTGRMTLKKARLSQAVAACKMGKMSQAAASSTFQVPKTTIWRQLQKFTSHGEIKPTIVIEKEDHELSIPEKCHFPLGDLTQANFSSSQSMDMSKSVIILDSSNTSEITVSNSDMNVEITPEGAT